MKRFIPLVFLLLSLSGKIHAQGVLKQTYHDPEKKNLKEVYQVKDTVHNILHGRYIAYFVNGNVESRGQFTNNETSGVWEFFYETGNLKMRGILFKSANYGLWEYFYESGQKSMEGIIYGKNREGEWKTYYENGQLKEVGEYKNAKRQGLWKTYFEDGVKKGEIDYTDDFGTYTEYFHSGKVLSQGPRSGTRNVGHWRYFAEDGTLQSEGDFDAGKKNGVWTSYYPSGKTAARGSYDHDALTGRWEHFHENGIVSSAGDYTAGVKSGAWKTFNTDGTAKSEVSYDRGAGEFREYFSSGKLKAKGKLVNEKKEGKWEYFAEDGKKEGECDFTNGKGTYYGYYPNGTLQTKGTMEDDLKTGTWEIYEPDGKLSGYYRPFYDKDMGKEIAALAGKSDRKKTVAHGKRLTYFDTRANELKGVIIGGNPVLMFAGRFPMGIEFYNQERLGHEFEFVGIRDPFFLADLKVPAGKKFERGYAIAIKQKLYNPLKAGMWYFGHEFRFTNFGHFINETSFTASAVEQRFEWGVLAGYRILQHSRGGFTIDAFVSYDIGYRSFDVDTNFSSYFSDIEQKAFSQSAHFGFNLGNMFSFR